MKLYIIKKGVFAGANNNAISIHINPKVRNQESLLFIGKLSRKVRELAKLKGQVPHIGVNYGAVTFRYELLEENKALAKLLIKIVETEELFLKQQEISYQKFKQIKQD